LDVDELTKRTLVEVGERMKAARVAAGYETAAKFARELGKEEASYRQYERGEMHAPYQVFVKICRLTSVSLEFMLTGKNQ